MHLLGIYDDAGNGKINNNIIYRQHIANLGIGNIITINVQTC